MEIICDTKYWLSGETRMYSSRMRTVRCSSRLSGGGLPGGCLPDPPSHVDRMTGVKRLPCRNFVLRTVKIGQNSTLPQNAHHMSHRWLIYLDFRFEITHLHTRTHPSLDLLMESFILDIPQRIIGITHKIKTSKYNINTCIQWTRVLHHVLHKNVVLIHNYLSNDDNDSNDECQ